MALLLAGVEVVGAVAVVPTSASTSMCLDTACPAPSVGHTLGTYGHPVAPALDRLFRNPETGRLVVAQAPNLPLGIFLTATAVRLAVRPEGAAGMVTAAIGNIGLAWWAVDEVVRGESPFRRVLGAVVLSGLVLRLLTR